MAVLLLGTTGGPVVAMDFSLYELLSYCLRLISAALTLRVLTTIFSPRDATRRR